MPAPDVQLIAPPTAPSVRDDAAFAALRALAPGAHAAVFGAPGSGKTGCAVELVADRVARGALAPDEVVVLAATRASASALRDALALRLGVPTRGALARTANSVAFELVRAHLGVPVTLLTGAEHDRIIADLLDAATRDGGGPAWPDRLGDDVRALRGFRDELRELMMRAVEHGLDGASLAQLGRMTGRDEWIAAGEFLDEYAEIKEQLRPTQFDSSELAAFAASILRAGTESELGALGRIRLVVVDDAQEATEGTAALLAAFAVRGASVVAFGDPDVASNGFRGGRPELLGSLSAVLGAPVARLRLEGPRRGRPELRALVRSVTERIGTALGGAHRGAASADAPAESGAAEETGADAAARVLDPSEDDGALDTLAARGGTPVPADPLPPLVAVDAASASAEAAAVAAHLRERHLLDGIPWSRMVVVLRSGADVPVFERALARCDVPTGATAATRVALRDAPAASALLTAASIALGREPLAPETAVALLTGPLGRLDAVGLRRLRLALRHEELATGGTRTGDELLVEALGAPGGFETIDAASARRAGRLARVLHDARALAARGGTIEEVLWAVWSGAGVADEWAAQANGTGLLAEEANRALDAVVALFAAAQRFVEREPAAPAVRFVDDVLASEVPEDSLAPQRAADRVVVTTPPALVGRAFDVVVIARLQEGVWPNLRPRGSLLHATALPAAVRAARTGAPAPADETASAARAAVRDDELRLFALAASRATRQLVLTCTSDDEQQPSVLMGYAADAPAPRRRRPLHLRGLVGALRRDLVAAARRGGVDREAAAALALLAEEGVAGAHPDDWYGTSAPTTIAPLVDLADEEAVVPVSPSQIDRVEESALGWFVDHVAAPPSGIAAAIGTIVHAVVEAAATADGPVTVDELWAAVQAEVDRLPFAAGWVAERERRGARRMAEGAADYLAQFRDDGKVLLGAEGRFELRVGRVRLTGTVDRVEASPDGTTVIVDLKTGRTPPTGEQTAAHPQLAAYQLAARAGALPDAGRPGGAKLVYLARPVGGAAYTERAQQPFDDDAEAAFLERLDAVARRMAAAEFPTPADPGYRSRFGGWQYRVHVVPAVSA